MTGLGAGHYEMNMVKSLFSGWFPLYLEPVAELLGFRSPKAKWYVQNCSDHHKAWQILEVQQNVRINVSLYLNFSIFVDHI